MSQSPPIVLTFAATDPSGGAGLQADILTLSSMGCHALSVVTAVTVQDTVGVEDVMPLDAEWVADQARSVLEDMPVSVFKIGLLGSVEIIAAIAEVVSDYPEVPLVLDPVLSSGRGDELATDDMVIAMRELLIPQTTLITPNSLEARRLAIDDGDDNDDPALEECSRRILTLGCEYVLITGTHENTPQVVNVLYSQEGVVRSDSWQRLPGIDRRDHRERPADYRGRARCTGVHLAGAQLGVSSRHGPVHPGPLVLGARRRRRG
jgi:hydroxymethylpyrimidine/phosphomethylpyrimidine kinase